MIEAGDAFLLGVGGGFGVVLFHVKDREHALVLMQNGIEALCDVESIAWGKARLKDYEWLPS